MNMLDAGASAPFEEPGDPDGRDELEIVVRPRLSGPLAVLQGMLYELASTQRRMRRVEAAQERDGVRQDRIEARVDSLEGHSGWRTVTAYCREHELPCHLEFRKALGRKAAALCRDRGIKPGRTRDERWGYVGCYPEELLREAAASLES